MATQAPATPHPTEARQPRLLWVTPSCQLDTTSGAALAARTTLRMLAVSGYEVMFLGATLFDHGSGSASLRALCDYTQLPPGSVFEVTDHQLRHRLVATQSPLQRHLTEAEAAALRTELVSVLRQFRPDAIMYYGSSLLTTDLAALARSAGAATVFLLCNGSYTGTAWAQHADLIITEGQATADWYAPRLGFRPTPVGCFIDPATVVAATHSRQRVLFVNPARHKGVKLVVGLALILQNRRPDIGFEVVQSRGNDWEQALQQISADWGQPTAQLGNVCFTPNSDDMRPVYGRARLLLAPSLWWESWGRVVTEAGFNGIPALITDRGGLPEAMHNGGIKVQLPDVCHQWPHATLPPLQLLEAMARFIERCFDDPAYYQKLSQQARQSAWRQHHPQRSAQRLLAALAPWVNRPAAGQATHFQ